MKKKVVKKEDLTNQDLAKMMENLDGSLKTLGKSLDVRISKMESYMKEGFASLDNKIEHIDERLSQNITGLNRRVDDLAENKASRITYKELEQRVNVLEKSVFKKSGKINR